MHCTEFRNKHIVRVINSMMKRSNFLMALKLNIVDNLFFHSGSQFDRYTLALFALILNVGNLNTYIRSIRFSNYLRSRL